MRLELHRKGVLAVFALRPQLALVLGDDAFGDGQAQTEAAVAAAGFVHAVKPLEDLLQLLKTYSNPYIVVLRCTDRKAEEQATQFLKVNCDRCVVKSKSVQKGAIELNLKIRLKNDDSGFVNLLSDMQGVDSAVMVSYNGDYMG